ncbi:hypothetical protein EMIHUDRAFT_97183 [Emiliania huxleyi CCMP1516]|uniref:Methyltransferase type 11 domain-containing protein n=2 Tax=Emiliania huxleyi TaxID=2903 RepID=A0A0D3I1Y2_EMIH1|nr:hypothetical protein EMIHUDRAFT_97183 [Emiliania huxleyi CCMP1516]EOD05267.1 hypothetical protein EMIHUDRAFT_97183 [Emiliania huxleyi CCMP1516]|eukprot:XP_005757696.1 hypothetical protein EMIHUDRAFT_97183 [Emiliania huxleyi CCMP1516]
MAAAPAAVPDDDTPVLFASHVPAGGLTVGMQAVAALLDEEEAPGAASSRSGRKRNRASMGEVQIQLALASCDQAPSQRRRAEPAAAPAAPPPAADDATGEDPEPPFRCPCGDALKAPLRGLLSARLASARDGSLLTEAEAAELASGAMAVRLLRAGGEGEAAAALEADPRRSRALSRALYQDAVSWALYSAEWADALAAHLRSRGCRSVLEVAAGAGVLAAPMRRRGLAWRTTDAAPSRVGLPAGLEPEACDAAAALAPFGVDAVFWAWWPRGDEGDAALAEECARLGLPALFVGEPKGGCTGSDAVWERAGAPRPLSSEAEGLGGVDVPRWPGVRDRTWHVGRRGARAALPLAAGIEYCECS